MKNLALSILSHDWAGLVLATIVVALGWLGLRAARTKSWRLGTGASWAVISFGSLMLVGSMYHLVYLARVRSECPVPGRLVDVGGYRVHVLAEGDAHGGPSIVWMPGAHSAGFYLHHLHRALRTQTRSILIDRPGSGWSDIGPFPRTTPLEAEEVVAALERSGESGPFIFVGHSFGGLLIANIARRHPELVAALVLLDATPPDAINYAPNNPFLSQMRSDAWMSALQRLFGIHAQMAKRLWEEDPRLDAARIGAIVENRLGSVLTCTRAVEDSARSHTANASIFDELAPGGLGWDAMIYDGDLGDLRLYLVAPREMPEFKDTSAGMMDKSGANALRQQETQRLMNFYRHARERYMLASSRAERIVVPPGYGHNFPYEAPDFVVAALRKVLDDVAASPRK